MCSPVCNMYTFTHTLTHRNDFECQSRTNILYIKAGRTKSAAPQVEGTCPPQFSRLVHAEQKHTELLSWLYVQNMFSQAGEFAVLQCFDQPAQLGCSPLRLDESAEQLIGLLIQPFSLVLIGQVVYGRTLQSPAALSQGPPYMLPLTAHSVREALNICR